MGIAEIVGTIVVAVLFSWFLIEVGKGIQEKEDRAIINSLKLNSEAYKSYVDDLEKINLIRMGGKPIKLNAMLSFNPMLKMDDEEKFNQIVTQLGIQFEKNIRPYVKIERIKEVRRAPFEDVFGDREYLDIYKGTVEFYIKPPEEE